MSVVRINVIEVPPGRGAVLEERFAARAGEVDTVDGFNSFELLRPTDGTDRYLVVTRWRDVASYEAWVASESFARSHGEREPATVGSGSEVHSPGAGSQAAGTGSELWSFEVVVSAGI